MNKNQTTDLKIFCASLIALTGSLGWYWAAAAGGANQTYATVGAPAISKSNLSLGGGQLFEVRFDPVWDTDDSDGIDPNGGGDLIARALDAAGTFSLDVFDENGVMTTDGADWRAKNTITAQSKRANCGGDDCTLDNRVIITSGDNDSGDLEGRRFSWDNADDTGLTTDMKDDVDPLTDAANNDHDASPIANWTRGWDVNEGADSTDLRVRTNVLGNVVHPTPQFSGPPFKDYNFDDYEAFRTAEAVRLREPMVFSGGADAMLHGHKASDGTEVFAFIPRALLGSLKNLADQGYEGDSFGVDGSPVVDDAFGAFPGCDPSPCWQTVLLGGLGDGGDAVYALNVTDPVADADTEANAASNLFLWEFTDADLGLTTARPIIARLGDGTWAAIFGNGQGTGTFLYVVDIATGALIQKLEVDATGSGLSSPVAWNADFDSGHTIEYVYAGDRTGNLWKFDFRNATDDCPNHPDDPDTTSDDADHNAHCAGIAFSGSPLVTVTDPDTNSALPIIVKPLISINPSGGVYIYFGTGANGQSLTDTNGLFGIKDTGSALGAAPSLDVNSVAPIIYDNPDDPDEPDWKYRIINDATEGADAVGWKLKLPTGERILNDPILNNERVGFTSTDPTVDVFNQNWFTAIDYTTGGAPAAPFLDLNGDGLFTDSDKFDDIDGDGITDLQLTVPIGRFLDTGVVSAPTPANILDNNDSKDTVFIAHGLESIPAPPDPSAFLFNDPGLPGGHFDHDTSEEEGSSKRDHTHEYDDKYDLNGVNILNSGGSIGTAGEVLTASGMLSAEKALKDNDEFLEDTIRLRIRNPNSWDTQGLFNLRQLKGLEPAEGAGPAGPVEVYYHCAESLDEEDIWASQGHTVGNAPEVKLATDFGVNPGESLLVDDEGFTYEECILSHIRYLKVRITSINSLRASLPGCVRNNSLLNLPDDPILTPGGNPQGNDGYRDGAFTVQALHLVDGEWTVFWEDYIYEHITGASLEVNEIANDPDNPNIERSGASSNCEALNEDLRAYKDPDYFDGDSNTTSGTDPGDPAQTTTSGVQLTETINVTQSSLAAGRVSWREVLGP